MVTNSPSCTVRKTKPLHFSMKFILQCNRFETTERHAAVLDISSKSLANFPLFRLVHKVMSFPNS